MTLGQMTLGQMTLGQMTLGSDDSWSDDFKIAILTVFSHLDHAVLAADFSNSNSSLLFNYSPILNVYLTILFLMI